MILFLISFLLVTFASYFLTSVFIKRNDVSGIFTIPLIAFAEVVLTFECLSLFSAISQIPFIILNVLFFFLVFLLWYKKSRKFWYINPRVFLKRFRVVLCSDKYLLALFIGFLFLNFVSLFLVCVSPVVNSDAWAYHVLRSVFWVMQGNLNHFDIADARNLIFPINSELLYSWVLLFIKKDIFLGLFSFIGYLLTISGIYNILSLIRVDMRRKLWVIFVVSAFSSVVILSSGTETDIIISGLVLSSIYLFWKGVQSQSRSKIFWSSLAYALAIGTKTTALLLIPGVGIGFCALAYFYLKAKFYQPILYFLLLSILNFLLFASYNYALNYLNYGNIAGMDGLVYLHKNFYGIRAIPANFIKYIFLFFDFTGFRWSEYIGDNILAFRDSILGNLGLSDISDGLFSSKVLVVNKSLLEPLAGMGIVGLLTFLPCLLISFVKPLFCKNAKSYFILAFALLFVVNLLVMSYELMFMSFSIRFLTSFCLISSPILIYTYSKKNNIYNFLIVFFSMFSFLLISTHIWSRPFFRIVKYFKAGASVQQVRNILSESVLLKNISSETVDFDSYLIIGPTFALKDFLSKYDVSNKILIFSNLETELLPLKMMEFKGHHLDVGLIENIRNIDLSAYNIVVTINDSQNSYLIKDIDNDYCTFDAIDSTEGNIIFRKKCTLNDEFFDSQGYFLLDSFDVIDYNLRLFPTSKAIEKSSEIEYYKIYENKNNPIKR